MPIKILIALQYYVPHRTGLTLHVQRIAESLARRGHQVTVLTARFRRDLPQDEQVVNGVRVVRLWAPIHVSRGMIMPAYPLAALRLVRAHDVVSVHTPMLEAALFGVLARLFNKGLVITHHGDLILPNRWINRLIMWATFQLYKIGARAANHIIAYSQDYADHSYYLAQFLDKTIPIYPPISVPQPNAQHAELLRAKWLEGTDGKARLIAYAGRFVEEKRPDILIKALATIHKTYPGSRVVFAGEYDISYEDFYERHQDLVNQYRDSLIFLGLLTDEQSVADFYAACDVLALPSDTECFALVQVEAMRCGTPVVATDIAGARQPVRVTGMGEIVPPGDAIAFGAGVIRVLDHPSQYVKPLTQIDAAFNFEETTDRYEQTLIRAVETAHSHKRRPPQ
jgi:glycosyltransferase involved in cell wall biosynthesis